MESSFACSYYLHAAAKFFQIDLFSLVPPAPPANPKEAAKIIIAAFLKSSLAHSLGTVSILGLLHGYPYRRYVYVIFKFHLQVYMCIC